MQGEATESFQEDYSSRSSEEEKSPEDPLPTRSHITVEGLEKPNWREAYAKCAWWQDMYMAQPAVYSTSEEDGEEHQTEQTGLKSLAASKRRKRHSHMSATLDP